MIHKELPFNVGPWYGDTPPEVSYHPEIQAAAVAKAQRDGALIYETFYFSGFAIVREMDLRWFILSNGTFDGGTKFCAADANASLFEDMRLGTQLTFIQTKEMLPEIFDGRNKKAVAAILVRGDFLYKSPGFDLKLYEAQGLIVSQEPTTKIERPSNSIIKGFFSRILRR